MRGDWDSGGSFAMVDIRRDFAPATNLLTQFFTPMAEYEMQTTVGKHDDIEKSTEKFEDLEEWEDLIIFAVGFITQ